MTNKRNVAVFSAPSELVGWSSTLASRYRSMARVLLEEAESTHFHIHYSQGFCLELARQAVASGHQVTLYRDESGPLIPPWVKETVAGVPVKTMPGAPRLWVKRLLGNCEEVWCLRFPHPEGSEKAGYGGLVNLACDLSKARFKDLWPLFKGV